MEFFTKKGIKKEERNNETETNNVKFVARISTCNRTILTVETRTLYLFGMDINIRFLEYMVSSKIL